MVARMRKSFTTLHGPQVRIRANRRRNRFVPAPSRNVIGTASFAGVKLLNSIYAGQPFDIMSVK